MVVGVSDGEAAVARGGRDSDGTAGGQQQQQQRGTLLALPDAMLSEVLGEFFLVCFCYYLCPYIVYWFHM